MNFKQTMSGKEVLFYLSGMALFVWIMASAGGVSGLYDAVMPAQIPGTFKEAGLDNKQWSADNAKLAAKITVKSLKRLDEVIADADRRGDSLAASKTLDEFITIMRGWNDQQGSAASGKHHDCVLATIHAMDGATSVVKGGNYQTRDRFEAALDGCKSSI